MAYKQKTLAVSEGGTGVATSTGLNVASGTTNFANTTFVDVTSWTPNLQLNSDSTGFAYTTQLGKYTRIGNIVYFWFHIVCSTKGSGVGNLTLSNLPVTTITAGGMNIPINRWASLTPTANTGAIVLRLASSSTVGTFITNQFDGTASAQISNAMITNTFSISTTGSYLIA